MCCEPLDASWFRVLRRMAVRFRLCFGLQRRAVTCTKSYTKGSWPPSGRGLRKASCYIFRQCAPRQPQDRYKITYLLLSLEEQSREPLQRTKTVDHKESRAALRNNNRTRRNIAGGSLITRLLFTVVQHLMREIQRNLNSIAELWSLITHPPQLFIRILQSTGLAVSLHDGLRALIRLYVMTITGNTTSPMNMSPSSTPSVQGIRGLNPTWKGYV